jgi:hypothetical protein
MNTNRSRPTYVSSKSQMPTKEHWAIIEYSHIYVPGDERSRTHPGHGYPASNQPVLNYIAFDSKEDLEKYFQEHSTMKIENVTIIHVKPAVAKTVVSIEVKLD